ncbi:MAG: hypothetical protein WBB22_07205 [Anaerolineae bacterium]
MCQLLRDDVQPVEVDGVGIADDHGQRGSQVEHVVGGGCADGLAHSHAGGVVGELELAS